MTPDLRPVDQAVIRNLSDVWETVYEIGIAVRSRSRSTHPFTNAQIAGSLRRLRRLGLVDYRWPSEGLPGDWAITPEGDAAAEALP